MRLTLTEGRASPTGARSEPGWPSGTGACGVGAEDTGAFGGREPMPAHLSLQPGRISARAVFWKHQFKACANLLPGPFSDHNLFFLELTLLVACLCATAWCRRAVSPAGWPGLRTVRCAPFSPRLWLHPRLPSDSHIFTDPSDVKET